MKTLCFKQLRTLDTIIFDDNYFKRMMLQKYVLMERLRVASNTLLKFSRFLVTTYIHIPPLYSCCYSRKSLIFKAFKHIVILFPYHICRYTFFFFGT